MVFFFPPWVALCFLSSWPLHFGLPIAGGRVGARRAVTAVTAVTELQRFGKIKKWLQINDTTHSIQSNQMNYGKCVPPVDGHLHRPIRKTQLLFYSALHSFRTLVSFFWWSVHVRNQQTFWRLQQVFFFFFSFFFFNKKPTYLKTSQPEGFFKFNLFTHSLCFLAHYPPFHHPPRWRRPSATAPPKAPSTSFSLAHPHRRNATEHSTVSSTSRGGLATMSGLQTRGQRKHT